MLSLVLPVGPSVVRTSQGFILADGIQGRLVTELSEEVLLLGWTQGPTLGLGPGPLQ